DAEIVKQESDVGPEPYQAV
nr:LCP2=major cuticular protein {N-terminal} [Ceratitis capitata=Mediterranean fruit flies, cuticle, third instar larvae, Peptide Partial, 19 aa] [Ceratitis capitata]